MREVDAEAGRSGAPVCVGDEVGALVDPGDGGAGAGQGREAKGFQAEAAADVEDTPAGLEAAALARERFQRLHLRDAVEGFERSDVARDMAGAVHVDELLQGEVVHHSAPPTGSTADAL